MMEVRQEVELPLKGTVGEVIGAALNHDTVRLMLAAFVEGRELPGSWQIRVTQAVLVPVDPEVPGGIPT